MKFPETWYDKSFLADYPALVPLTRKSWNGNSTNALSKKIAGDRHLNGLVSAWHSLAFTSPAGKTASIVTVAEISVFIEFYTAMIDGRGKAEELLKIWRADKGLSWPIPSASDIATVLGKRKNHNDLHFRRNGYCTRSRKGTSQFQVTLPKGAANSTPDILPLSVNAGNVLPDSAIEDDCSSDLPELTESEDECPKLPTTGSRVLPLISEVKRKMRFSKSNTSAGTPPRKKVASQQSVEHESSKSSYPSSKQTSHNVQRSSRQTRASTMESRTVLPPQTRKHSPSPRIKKEKEKSIDELPIASQKHRSGKAKVTHEMREKSKHTSDSVRPNQQRSLDKSNGEGNETLAPSQSKVTTKTEQPRTSSGRYSRKSAREHHPTKQPITAVKSKGEPDGAILPRENRATMTPLPFDNTEHPATVEYPSKRRKLASRRRESVVTVSCRGKESDTKNDIQQGASSETCTVVQPPIPEAQSCNNDQMGNTENTDSQIVSTREGIDHTTPTQRYMLPRFKKFQRPAAQSCPSPTGLAKHPNTPDEPSLINESPLHSIMKDVKVEVDDVEPCLLIPSSPHANDHFEEEPVHALNSLQNLETLESINRLAECHDLLDDYHPIANAAVFPRPCLRSYPPIWAQSRQEVCEAFDWFRSYQGGVYFNNNAVNGYLLSAFSASRDLFYDDGKLIISHGGGKAESVHDHLGILSTVEIDDQQADDKSVRALLDNHRTQRPLALVIDDKYVHFPYSLVSKNVTYAVLGFYTIVHAWAEHQKAENEVGHVVRYKFAFQWCEGQGIPWWHDDYTKPEVPVAPQSSLTESKERPRKLRSHIVKRTRNPMPKKLTGYGCDEFIRALSPNKVDQRCLRCNGHSPQVYTTWVCLQPECWAFFRRKDGVILDLESLQLEYNPAFLEPSPSLFLSPEFKLDPPEPPTSASSGVVFDHGLTRGLHCRNCGRLSCRFQWESLTCSHCNQKLPIQVSVRHARELRNDHLPFMFDDYEMTGICDMIALEPFSFRHDSGRGTVQSFSLPEERGFIHHIRAGNAQAMLEADEIFIKYQEQANSGQLRFRRWPMRAHKCRGALLTNYFSHNAGEPYQYVGGDANTVPFSEAPAVCDARDLIQKRILQALDKKAEFNEVLSAAYMERQSMAFHSDAEVGLGPLVAGLSMGSPAAIHFRLHPRHDPFDDQRGIMLTIVLRHGDILVMDGHGVQEYYEHTVIPNNFRIAATARQITPQHHELSASTSLKVKLETMNVNMNLQLQSR